MIAGKQKIHYSFIILSVVTLVVFASLGLARFGYSVVLPPMQSALKITNAQTGLLATINLIGYLLSSVIGGALASRFGPRRVIGSGLALTGACMILTGFSVTFWQAAAARFFTGIGSGASNVPAMGLLQSWFSAKKRGLASGIGVAGSSVALIFTGAVVPDIMRLSGAEGWRAGWYLYGVLSLFISLLAFLFLRNHPSEINIIAYGDGRNPSGKAAAENVKLLSVYRSPRVWSLGFVYTAFGYSYIIYMTYFIKFLNYEAGYSLAEAGRLFMVMGWFSLFCGIIWGSVSDYIGRPGALTLVYLVHTAAFSLFALFKAPSWLLFSAILFGLSAWSIPAIMAAACGDILGSKLAPAALGFITLFFGIGQAAGPVAAGALADRSGSFQTAFAMAAAAAFLGALGSLILIRKSTA